MNNSANVGNNGGDETDEETTANAEDNAEKGTKNLADYHIMSAQEHTPENNGTHQRQPKRALSAT